MHTSKAQAHLYYIVLCMYAFILCHIVFLFHSTLKAVFVIRHLVFISNRPRGIVLCVYLVYRLKFYIRS